MLCHASGFEDIDYWVQLTGLNKQKTGPNSGGIQDIKKIENKSSK